MAAEFSRELSVNVTEMLGRILRLGGRDSVTFGLPAVFVRLFLFDLFTLPLMLPALQSEDDGSILNVTFQSVAPTVTAG